MSATSDTASAAAGPLRLKPSLKNPLSDIAKQAAEKVDSAGSSVEERPFQGRVRDFKSTRALAQWSQWLADRLFRSL
jgi:hypothetical protein